jgi:hypothetical protein
VVGSCVQGEGPAVTPEEIDRGLEGEVLRAAEQWVKDNRDTCYQDNTVAGYLGRDLMEAIDAWRKSLP